VLPASTAGPATIRGSLSRTRASSWSRWSALCNRRCWNRAWDCLPAPLSLLSSLAAQPHLQTRQMWAAWTSTSPATLSFDAVPHRQARECHLHSPASHRWLEPHPAVPRPHRTYLTTRTARRPDLLTERISKKSLDVMSHEQEPKVNLCDEWSSSAVSGPLTAAGPLLADENQLHLLSSEMFRGA